MKIPNFFIIGAPKSGTTALSEYLNCHPRIFMSKPKEPEYFDLDYSCRARMSLKTYLALFSKAQEGVHQGVGEASTSYLSSRSAVPGILKFNPDAKFIAMLRNPVDLVQSLHSQKVFEGEEDIMNFEEAWRAEPDRRAGKRIPFSCTAPRKLLYSEWGNLGGKVDRLFSIAGREIIKIILFDDFARDTKIIYEEVLAFLGLPTDHRAHFPRVNEGKTVRWTGLQLKLGYCAGQVRRIKAKLGMTAEFGLFNQFLKWNSERGKRTPCSKAFRAELGEYYRSEINKLSDLLGRNLSGWFS